MAKRMKLQTERERLRGAIVALQQDIADASWTIREIEIHLAAHFAGAVGWAHWIAVQRLGALTGLEVDHENGRYPRRLVRNLRHFRIVYHGERRRLYCILDDLQARFAAVNDVLPGLIIDAAADAAGAAAASAATLSLQMMEAPSINAQAAAMERNAPLFRAVTEAVQGRLF